MNKSTSQAAILSVALERNARQPLQAQLAQTLRDLVHGSRLRPGDRLPSSRGLAEELAVSRVTVTTAYDQLIAEGYLEGRRGSGVYVAADLPDLPAPDAPDSGGAEAPDLALPEPDRPFQISVPDLREFPFRDWARLSDQIWRAPEPALLTRPDPLGWPPLRAAIAGHLRDWRGLDCKPGQIVITSGLAETLELIARAVLPPGGRVAVEEPGHGPLRTVLTRAGLEVAPVPVDEQGFDIDRAPPGTAAAVVTPSRQFPLGMILPLARRLRLLAWARETGGTILEDDFDGEYRYRGQPLPAVMSLDDGDRVLYVGSFSKVLFPALRLAFAVLPEPLAPQVEAVIRSAGPKASLMPQPVLARFIETGGFATHIRRMRRLYATRQKALTEAIARHAPDLFEAEAEPGGMHLVVRPGPALAGRMSDREAVRIAESAGIAARPLSAFFAGPPDREGFILGYAAFGEAELDAAVRCWAEALRRQL
ncbi:MAG: PLP-dependent aminotransferase family protein [Minwuia sp.]|uniref:MocR-like pyridoxine biosynthesis transcription factor PdxR n=1 Tax=Minwuia sp. TaxID=2493630 RepID=UPI003A8C311E